MQMIERVNFHWFHLQNDADEIGCVAEVAIIQEQFNTGLMTISINVLDLPSVETRRPTDDTMDLVNQAIQGENEISDNAQLGDQRTIDEHGQTYVVPFL
jgi:hypothetical protein